jgi:NodT family efflux transporter outer membrane factor (OMF) lipoprotein
MKNKIFAIVLANFMMISGCSLAPSYEVPKQAIPENFKESEPWQLAQPSDQQLRGDWWQLFNDANLNSLEDRINSSNQDLAVAYARYQQSKSYEVQASASLYPTIQGFAGVTGNRQSDDRPLRGSDQPDTYGANTIGLAASYELDLWDRVHNIVAASKASLQASAAELESVRLALHANLASYYIELRGLDARIQLLNVTLESYRRQSELIENRFKGGIASAQDVSRSQTQFQEAKTKVADVVASRGLLEHAIAVLVGEPASSFSIAPLTGNITQPEIPLGLPSTLLQRRPDIASAERRVAAADADIGVARAAFFPSITLGVDSGFQNTGGLGLLALPNSFWSIGPTALLTLFDAGKREAEVKRARAYTDETAAQYRATVLSAFKEVEDNLILLKQLRDEQVGEQAAALSAQRSFDIAMNRYREGIVNYLDVIDAEEALLRTKATSLDINTRSLNATVGLIRAIGGGWNGQLDPAITKK